MPDVDRRALLRIGLAGGALLAVPALARVTAADARSPFDTPFDTDERANATRDPRTLARARRVAPPTRIISRAECDADGHIRRRRIDFDRRVEKIIVHHTGTNSVESDWPAEVRSIYRSAIARGYRDMPYHWLIDPDGVIYEGRWARRMAPGTTPNGEDARGRPVRGGHALGHNERTIGIALLGTFDHHRPTLFAFDALIALAAWKCDRWSIDPAGESAYRLKTG